MPTIEVIILQHNRSELTVECIKSIREQEGVKPRITVIDQASLPEHREAVGPLVDHFSSRFENRPIHEVWNELLPWGADYVVCVNNDTYLASTCLARLLDGMESNVAWVAGAYQQGMDWNHCITPWPVEVLRDWNPRYPQALNEWARGLPPSARYFDRVEQCAWMTTPAIFREIGSFDQKALGSHFHDFDYGRRAMAMGYKMAVRYDAVFMHYKHQTVPGAVADGTWNDITHVESEQRLAEKYPGQDYYSVREL